MAANERAFDHQQLLRTRAVFEKLSVPSDSFYHIVRWETTQLNRGNYRRESGIAVMMPYQYWYHRLGEAKHKEYPDYLDASASISTGLEWTHGTLEYFPDWQDDPEANRKKGISGGSELKICQHMPNDISKEVLASFERFADQITREWQAYQGRKARGLNY